jgi:uncharacterized protein DUF4265
VRGIERVTDEENPEPLLAKVGLRGPDGEVETLWAFKLSPTTYRLDNTPWYAYGVSYRDVIEALPDEDGYPFFTRVLEKSGYRTLRVALEAPASTEFLQSISALGCRFEGANQRYIAIDIPAAIDLRSVTDHLVARGVQWEYADPTHEAVTGDTGS